MRRSARGEQSAFSLFPFLAVLLCTMGSLVVLLVAMAHISRQKAEVEAEAARVAAEAARVETDSPERRQLEAQIVEATGAVSRLRLAKAEGQQRLQQEQKRLSDIEDHMRRLSDEAEALVTETKELIAVEDQHYDDAKIAEQELERLNKLAGEIVDEIERLKHAAAGRERKFAVVSLREGRSGTLRPPVYFECTESGVTLQPEGIKLTWEDLVAPEFSSPLAAAARAVERYYEEHPEARAANENGLPYPLMLVRPDGVRAHKYARAAFHKAGLDFGFQPVAEEWPLEYGSTNPVLSQAIEDAIRATRFERQGLARSIPQLAEAMEEVERSDISAELTVATQPDGFAQAVPLKGVRTQGNLRVRPADAHAANPFEGMHIEGSLPGEVGSSGYGGAGSGSSPLNEVSEDGAKASPLLAGMTQPTTSVSSPAAPGAGAPSSAVSSSGVEGIASTASVKAAENTKADSVGQRYGAVTTPNAAVGEQPRPDDSRNLLATTGVAADSTSSQTHGEASVTVGSNKSQKASNAGAGPSSKSQTSRDGLPMIRPIRLYVSHDRAVVLPDSAQTPEEMVKASASSQAIQFDGATTSRINDVIGVLKKHADTWGMAGDGMYWDPRLVLNVSGDGVDRADDVRRLLEAAGVKVQAYPVTTAANPEGGSDASRR